CPAINLYFHEVCTRCDAARLTDCAAHNPDFNSPYRVFPVEQRLSIREGLARLLLAHGVTMVVPTDSVRRHLIGIVPALAGLRLETIPHGRAPVLRPVAPPAREAGARLRVLVLGIQSVTKGMKLLFEVLPELIAFADVYLVGAREAGELFRYRPGVHVVDEYCLEDLPAIVDGIAPDCGLLLSTWPETFSYTLSELLQMHIPPVATRVGGFADRVHDGEDGILFDPNKPSLLACLRAIDADRGRLARIRAAVAALPARSLADMVADYHRLLPPPTGECLMPAALAADPATGNLLAALDSWKRAKGLGVRLDMKEGRLREVHEELERLRGEAEGLRGAVLEREQRIAELHASTSWRVSRPLRWLGTYLKRWRS
ncbi:MAG TPA: glycosyltransferase, partial [Zoogloea sp.]|nr:glycosyltransferase [Zoogloea sp.]